MTVERKSALEKALEAETALQDKLALRWFILKKQMTRKDWIEAVEALDTAQEDWSEIDMLIVFAHKADPAKTWADYMDMSQGDLEQVILGK